MLVFTVAGVGGLLEVAQVVVPFHLEGVPDNVGGLGSRSGACALGAAADMGGLLGVGSWAHILVGGDIVVGLGGGVVQEHWVAGHLGNQLVVVLAWADDPKQGAFHPWDLAGGRLPAVAFQSDLLVVLGAYAGTGWVAGVGIQDGAGAEVALMMGGDSAVPGAYPAVNGWVGVAYVQAWVPVAAYHAGAVQDAEAWSLQRNGMTRLDLETASSAVKLQLAGRTCLKPSAADAGLTLGAVPAACADRASSEAAADQASSGEAAAAAGLTSSEGAAACEGE